MGAGWGCGSRAACGADGACGRHCGPHDQDGCPWGRCDSDVPSRETCCADGMCRARTWLWDRQRGRQARGARAPAAPRACAGPAGRGARSWQGHDVGGAGPLPDTSNSRRAQVAWHVRGGRGVPPREHAEHAHGTDTTSTAHPRLATCGCPFGAPAACVRHGAAAERAPHSRRARRGTRLTPAALPARTRAATDTAKSACGPGPQVGRRTPPSAKHAPCPTSRIHHSPSPITSTSGTEPSAHPRSDPRQPTRTHA